MNTHEQKMENRADYYIGMAEKAEAESKRLHDAQQVLGDQFWGGQPILVGHHSEGRHRRDLARMDGLMRRSVDASSKAKYYREKASATRNNTTISSDDEDAIIKLESKREQLVERQDSMKWLNKTIRSKKLTMEEKLKAMKEVYPTWKDSTFVGLFSKDYAGRIGFPSYQLTNNGAKIRSTEKRIVELEARAKQTTTTENIGDVELIRSIEENRFQIFFPDKPNADVRKDLKKSGYRWSPRNGCWQCYLNEHNIRYGKAIVTGHYGKPVQGHINEKIGRETA